MLARNNLRVRHTGADQRRCDMSPVLIRVLNKRHIACASTRCRDLINGPAHTGIVLVGVHFKSAQVHTHTLACDRDTIVVCMYREQSKQALSMARAKNVVSRQIKHDTCELECVHTTHDNNNKKKQCRVISAQNVHTHTRERSHITAALGALCMCIYNKS